MTDDNQKTRAEKWQEGHGTPPINNRFDGTADDIRVFSTLEEALAAQRKHKAACRQLFEGRSRDKQERKQKYQSEVNLSDSLNDIDG